MESAEKFPSYVHNHSAITGNLFMAPDEVTGSVLPYFYEQHEVANEISCRLQARQLLNEFLGWRAEVTMIHWATLANAN